MARIGKNQLIKLQKKYKTDEAIAKLYGITRQAVHRIRNKYGIMGIPTLSIFKSGEVADAIVGAAPKTAILEKVKPHIE